MPAKSKRIAVLGAGIQGACVALELAGRGYSVDLFERKETCVADASENNEGKIHLGYVYAHDKTLETARLMADGALSFAPLLRRWLGADLDSLCVSAPFDYVVHRNSLLSANEFEFHAKQVSAHLREKDGHGSYFGRDAGRLPNRINGSEAASLYCPESITAVYRTEEVAIDPVVLAGLVRARIADEPAIARLTGHAVTSVEETASGYRVVAIHDERETGASYDHVVNTLWTGRLPIDMALGLHPATDWSFRFKCYMRVAGPRTAMPSATIVLGPFGDIVNYDDGHLYLSWYPSGVTQWSNAPSPPESAMPDTGAETDRIRNGIYRGLLQIVPGISKVSVREAELRGGWIFASGSTDIDHPESRLHTRSAIGPRSRGRYTSIDTGKLTMAPLFAVQAADRIGDA